MNPSNRKTLIRQRGQIKGSVTRICTFMNSCELEPNLTLIKVKFEKLIKLWEQYDDVQTQLELNDDEGEDHSQDRDDFETMYDELKARMT
jgi:hypothetical protein